MMQQAAQALHTALAAAWADAADSKDQVALRSQKLAGMLALLQASQQQPWFDGFLHEHVAATYPKQFRCLLDAVLQAYVAACPCNCGPLLQAFLQVPGCTNLNSPTRRDLAALFRAPGQLSSCWQQQGAVVCSIVAYLSTCACQQLWALQQQQQQQQHQQQHAIRAQLISGAAGDDCAAPARQDKQSGWQEQRFGTAIGWLADCLVAAVPHQQLALVQLALATAVAQSTRLAQQQAAAVADKSHESQCTLEPAAKKPRLEEQQQQQQQQQRHLVAGQEQGVVNSGMGASMAAKQLGLQLLTGVCCCEVLQHGSRHLLPSAAVAAMAAVRGDGADADCALQYGSWLYRQLCLQVTAPPPVATAGAAAGGGSGAAGTAAGVQDAAVIGLQAPAALALLLQQLSTVGPGPVLQLVQIVMGATGSAGAVVGSAQQAAVHGSTGAAKGQRELQHDLKHVLAEAARQWRALPDTACQGKKQQKGKKGAKGQQPGQQQQHQPGMAAAAAAAEQALPVPLKQVMPDAPNVNATWVCRHIVPVLLQQAQEQATALAQQQGLMVAQHIDTVTATGAVVTLPAVVALAHLLAADGLLLPAAGEVLVSARYLAEALNSVPGSLQEAVAVAWRQQLWQRQAAAERSQVPRPVTGLAAQQRQQCKAANDLLPWKVLQPMLCLLSHVEHGSPFVQFIASCVQRCISHAAENSLGSSSSGGNSRVREVLQHILLPVRFGIKVSARLWLLQQLLIPEDEQQQGERQHALLNAPDTTAQGGSGVAAAVLDGLEQLLQGEGQQQLAEGLQLLAQQRQDPQQQQQQGADGKAGAAGVGRSFPAAAGGDGLSLQQTQALDLAAGLLQLVGTLGSGGTSVSAGAGAAAGAEAVVAAHYAWQQQAAKRLWEKLQAAAAAASCEIQSML